MLDNTKRKELLSKARQAGFPGSILDVFSAYEQGRDLIAEYQQEQKMKQAQQMSDFVASQTLQQPQMQQPQQAQQQLPSSPPVVQANVPVQMPEQQQPLVDSSRSTNVGIVPNQTGSYKGEAIFAKGGFKSDPPEKLPFGMLPPMNTLAPVEVKATRFDTSKYPDLGINQPLPTYRPVRKSTLEEEVYWNQVPDFYKKWGKDGIGEDVLELFDFTGIMSHDDAKRAYESWKESGRKDPTPEEGLEMFGAVPALGKLGKIKYIEKGVKPVTKYIPWQQILNTVGFGKDMSEQVTEDKKAKGGFKGEGPGCPEGYFKDVNGNCVKILPQSDFRGKEYFENFRTKEQRDKCLEFPGAEGCFKDKRAALQNKELPGYVREQLEYLTDLHPDTRPNYKYIDYDSVTGLTALKTLEQKPLTVKEYDDITGGYGTKILTGEVQNENTAKIAEMLDKREYIKDAYSTYAKNKLEQITDPKTGKLLPTNDPRAQIDIRETLWELKPTKENPKGGTVNDRRQKLGYPIGMGINDLFVDKENANAGDLPMSAMKSGVVGLFDKNKNLTKEGKEWAEKAVSKYGLDPAVIGYFNQSSMSDNPRTLAEYDPTLLVESERYYKQPILSVNMEDKNAPVLSWAQREPYLSKYSPDMEGAKSVTGAIKMRINPVTENYGKEEDKKINKKDKKKKMGGAKCYTCRSLKRRV